MRTEMMSNKGLEWSEIKALALKAPIFIFDIRQNEEVEFGEFIRAGMNSGGNFIVIANSIIYDKDDCHFYLTEGESSIRMTNNVIVKLMDNQQATAHAKLVAAIKESTKVILCV